jgi:hypothetical protein
MPNSQATVSRDAPGRWNAHSQVGPLPGLFKQGGVIRPMKVFDFDPTDYADTYRDQGWVHIREGVSEEFHAAMKRYANEELESHMLDSFAIKGKKEQSLFEFPDDVNYPDELFDVVAAVCGLDRAKMTLSERHIQCYEADAAPEPPAHKDRFPSQVSVGLSIEIPEESTLVIYPFEHRGVNAFNKSGDFHASLQPNEQPDVILRSAQEVELDDRARDVVMFEGSSTWHLRRRAARSLNLYLKFNDFGCDPLGEDPSTAELRRMTLEAIATGDGQLDSRVPVVARRFDSVSRVYLRNEAEALQAHLFGEQPFGITELQLKALRSVDGRKSLASVAGDLAGDGDPGEARSALVYLADRGAIDLVS